MYYEPIEIKISYGEYEYYAKCESNYYGLRNHWLVKIGIKLGLIKENK